MNEHHEQVSSDPIVQDAPKRKRELSLPTAIVVAGALIAIAVLARGTVMGAPGQASPDNLDLVTDVGDDDFIRGNPDAPITVIEYADFSCHFCAQYHPTLTRLVKESEGQIRWVYRHLPIFNLEAAVASTCVGKTAGDEAFWSFSDTLFQNADKFSSGYYRTTALALGADGNAYDTCIANPLVQTEITSSFRTNRVLLGFNATPHTIIIDKDGRKFSFSGAMSYGELSDVFATLGK